MTWLYLILSCFADDRTDTPAEKQARDAADAGLDDPHRADKEPQDKPPPWTSEPPHRKPAESVHDALVEGVTEAPREAGRDLRRAVSGE